MLLTKSRKRRKRLKARCFVEDIESRELYVNVDVVMHPVTRCIHEIAFSKFKEYKGDYIPVELAIRCVARGICHRGQALELSTLLHKSQENFLKLLQTEEAAL